MKLTNFINGLSASAQDIFVFFSSLAHNSSILGFLFGLIVATLVAAFLMSKDPRHIPIILRHSKEASFAHITKKGHHHLYNNSFDEFVTIYLYTRTLFLIAITGFFLMIATVAISLNQ